MIRSKNYIAIPPGETIREQIADRGMSPEEFSMKNPARNPANSFAGGIAENVIFLHKYAVL